MRENKCGNGKDSRKVIFSVKVNLLRLKVKYFFTSVQNSFIRVSTGDLSRWKGEHTDGEQVVNSPPHRPGPSGIGPPETHGPV